MIQPSSAMTARCSSVLTRPWWRSQSRVRGCLFACLQVRRQCSSDACAGRRSSRNCTISTRRSRMTSAPMLRRNWAKWRWFCRRRRKNPASNSRRLIASANCPCVGIDEGTMVSHVTYTANDAVHSSSSETRTTSFCSKGCSPSSSSSWFERTSRSKRSTRSTNERIQTKENPSWLSSSVVSVI